MPIITISRASFSKGAEVAEKVAERLGYPCIGRELLLEASREFGIPEERLEKALHDAPSILNRFTADKECHIAYVHATFLKFVRRDNVVYHGLAGHFFLKNVSHVLKVRVLADLEDRVRTEMSQEGLSKEPALSMLKKDDMDRKQWSRALYGVDTLDPNLYDLVIHLRKIKVPDAVDIICHAARLDCFKTTYESQKALEDLLVAAAVKAALIHLKPDIQVFSQNGKVLIGTSQFLIQDPDLARKVEEIAKKIPGVETVEIKAAHLVDWAE